ncbi:FMN-binding glutamate synthase family protein [Luminiphilus sp. nBUS_07]|uniref:FMN-binding glutamate synthase family protein n=1 Tax=Luminiphilus sp. nBUS_07 TaxID=3395314 RepID=UPI003EBD278E
MVKIHDFLMQVIEFSALLMATLILVGVVTIVVLYIIDVTQSQQAIRRNYPVIGRFRYLFEHLGVFFRQYFFAMDREELPFNRAQRGWIARAAKDIDHTIAFGSTKPIHTPGDILFLNSAFPKLDEETQLSAKTPLCFGQGYARDVYETHSVFHISAMSYGALSAPAIQALSMGAAKAGILLNTGEGGLAPFHLKGQCDLVYQIGTAKYGVRNTDGTLSDDKLQEIAAHTSVKMFEIKLSQGAKPGKGGILPAEKVTAVIASTRGIPMGQDSLSPNRHIDISSVDDLLSMIHRVREVTGKPVGIKFVLGQPEWLDDLCQAIQTRGLDFAPDFVTVDSADGGTGAAPQSLMDNVGLPADSSLPWVVDKLIEYGLRARIKVMASGKMSTPSGVAAALCLGADSVNTARGFMFALGCIQALQCNKNTCPTGITTHDPKLQKGLDPELKATRVANYARNLLHEVEVVAHSCGVVNPYELGREHAYLVTANGLPQRLTDRYPTSAKAHHQK